MVRSPPTPTLFPYTTLFRSHAHDPLFDLRDRAPLAQHQLIGLGIFDRIAFAGRDRYLQDRKSTRLNSSHLGISYAVFCLKKKMTTLGNERAEPLTVCRGVTA